MVNAYELLFDHVENMVCTLDVDGRFTSINPAGERVTGYSARELIGTLAVELVAAGAAGRGCRAVPAAARRRGPTLARTSPCSSRRDGTRGADRGHLDRLSRGRASRPAFSPSSTTSASGSRHKRRCCRASAAFAGPSSRPRSAWRSSTSRVGSSRSTTRSARSSATPADELVQKTFQEITHPDDLDLDLEYLGQLLGARSRPTRWRSATSTPTARSSGSCSASRSCARATATPLHFVSQIEDITQRKRAEAERDRLQEQLHHAQKLEAVGRLAGGIAHDFNNMLTGIRGYTELLLDGLDHVEPAQGGRGADQASSRAGVQPPASSCSPSAASRCSSRASSTSTRSSTTPSGSSGGWSASSVEVVVQHEADSALVEADPSEFEQLLLNLAANAGHAMPEGGRLVIRTANEELDGEAAASAGVKPGSYVVLSVSDYRRRHGRRHQGTRLRAVLHDEAPG